MKLKQLVVIFPVIFLIACGNRPSYVLSEKKMENVLFDLYIADGEINNNHELFSSDSLRKRNLLNSVLKKHKITGAQLDSSLNWYSGNLDKYLKINQNINTRYAEEIQKRKDIQSRELAMKSKRVEGMIILPAQRDSISFLTHLSIPSGIYTFESDTLMMRYGGTYDVEFNILGMDKTANPEFTMCVVCADTVYVKKSFVKDNGFFVESVQIPQGKKFEKVYGYIRIPEISSRTNLFLSDFLIILYTGQRRLLPNQEGKIETIVENN